MQGRLAVMGIPLEWPVYREDFYGLISELAIQRPNWSSVQCSVSEVLNMDMGLFFNLIENLREIQGKESRR